MSALSGLVPCWTMYILDEYVVRPRFDSNRVVPSLVNKVCKSDVVSIHGVKPVCM